MSVEFPDLLTYTVPDYASPLPPTAADMTPLHLGAADDAEEEDPASHTASPPAVPLVVPAQPTSPRHSNRSNRGVPPLRLVEVMVAAIDDTAADEPKTFKQAMKLPDKELWHQAIRAEVDSLVENKVYEIVDRPGYKAVVSSKWVFKKKRGISGEVEKYKARVVARGCTQEEGVDYYETFAPTVRCESVRMMLAEAAAEGFHTA